MPRTHEPLEPETMADVLHKLGGIPARRVLLRPPPGEATERDLVRLLERTDRLFELVDGVLVEKVVGFPEAILAGVLIKLLGQFTDERDLGLVAGADGSMRLMPGLVRLPDVSFISWDRLPRREIPDEAIPDLAPDLAVEVLGKGNTAEEMRRKLKEYFLTGVRLVWFVVPRKRLVRVYTAPDQMTELSETQTLDGGDVLPGFRLPLRQLFARLARTSEKSAQNKSGRPKPRSRRPQADSGNPG